MIWARWLLIVVTLLGAPLTTQAAGLIVLNYHDVVAAPGDDRFAISRATFVAHMDYLQQKSYRPISLPELERFVATGAALPNNAVLLTFDDGLKSYREFVAPLLEIYGFPSVVSLVTAWLDGTDVPPEYRGKLMTWDDARQVAASSRVSVISHTHNLHQGIPANVRGNLRSAATTRRYFSVAQQYESETDFTARVRADLEVSVGRIQQELGAKPRGIAWPYGEYDAVVAQEARALGMSVQFVLGNAGRSQLSDGMVPRILVVDRPDTAALALLLADAVTSKPQRFVEFSLDDYVGKSEAEQEALLSELLDRLQALHANAVIISPFTQDGRRVFFRTDAGELVTDVLDRVIHQIRNRLNIRRIVLRIPAAAQTRDERLFFTDLSRLIRFDSLLFDRGASDQLQRTAREVVPQYRAHATFGVAGELPGAREFDFTVMPANTLAGVEIDSSRLWAHLGVLPTAGKLSDSITDLSARGIIHYGFSLQRTGPAGLMDVNLNVRRSGGD